MRKLFILLSITSFVIISCKKDKDSAPLPTSSNNTSNTENLSENQFDVNMLTSNYLDWEGLTSRQFFCENENVSYGNETTYTSSSTVGYTFHSNGTYDKHVSTGGTISYSWQLSSDKKTLTVEDIYTVEYTIEFQDNEWLVLNGSDKNFACNINGDQYFSKSQLTLRKN